jgi:hypothetical protein
VTDHLPAVMQNLALTEMKCPKVCIGNQYNEQGYKGQAHHAVLDQLVKWEPKKIKE